MKDKREAVFRKAMVDRLSSPDELTEMLQVTKRPDWLILAAIGIVVCSGLTWASIAKLPIALRGLGVFRIEHKERTVVAPCGNCVTRSQAASGEGDKIQAVIFVPEAMANQIRPGLGVHIMPKDYSPQQYGFIRGMVARVRESPASNGVLQASLPEQVFQLCVARHLRIEVEVDLLRSENAPGGLQWSSGHGPRWPLPDGMEVEGEIVLREIHPIEWVLPWVR